jgi:hypothetical protein
MVPYLKCFVLTFRLFRSSETRLGKAQRYLNEMSISDLVVVKSVTTSLPDNTVEVEALSGSFDEVLDAIKKTGKTVTDSRMIESAPVEVESFVYETLMYQSQTFEFNVVMGCHSSLLFASY